MSAVEWLRFFVTEGLGVRKVEKLIEVFGSVEAIFGASVSDVAAAGGLRGEVARRLLSDESRERACHLLEEANGCGAQVLHPDHPGWPPQFQAMPDPPLLLFVKGSVEALSRRQVAIVGTRRASVYGRSVARKTASALSAAGLAVTSGLAEGIDTAAHKGALEARGITIAVLGTGPDVVYPPENRRLARRIVESGGALVTEFPPGTAPRRQNFPHRNRIIAALAEAVLVVEAPARSGALITANFAIDTGRTVMAVPGRMDDANFLGSHLLIQQGAKLVASVADVLEELGVAPKECPSAAKTTLPPEEAAVYGALAGGSETVEQIAAKTGLPAPRVLSALVRLQMRRLVAHGIGGRWTRTF